MEPYVLIVRLMAGLPAETIPVKDCSASYAWMNAAWEWADRSGITRDLTRGGPMVICVPMNLTTSTTETILTARIAAEMATAR